MEKIKRNKSIFFVLLIVLSVLAIAGGIVLFSKPTKVEAQVDSTINDFIKQMNDRTYLEGKVLENGMPLAMSSNPYDYIKDNEEFDKIIALGMDALPELVQIQKDTNKYDNFERYLIAIAIEEISKTDLKAYDEFAWDQANVFSKKWAKFEMEATACVQTIVNDEKSNDSEKLSQLAKYGMLSLKVMDADDDMKQSPLYKEAKEKFEKLSRDKLVNFAKR